MPKVSEQAIVALRRRVPTWGARKLLAWLAERYPEMDRPSVSRTSALLSRRGRVKPRRRQRRQWEHPGRPRFQTPSPRTRRCHPSHGSRADSACSVSRGFLVRSSETSTSIPETPVNHVPRQIVNLVPTAQMSLATALGGLLLGALMGWWLVSRYLAENPAPGPMGPNDLSAIVLTGRGRCVDVRSLGSPARGSARGALGTESRDPLRVASWGRASRGPTRPAPAGSARVLRCHPQDDWPRRR